MIITRNLLVWWRVFFLITLIFIVLRKIHNRISGILNYFVIQESLGLFFLLITIPAVQFLIVLIKVGVSPLHFWIFSIVDNLSGILVIWFLTFQKLPFLPVLIYLLNLSCILLILSGIFLCFLQIFFLKGYKDIVVLASTESFSWVLATRFFAGFNLFILLFYYMFVLIFFLPFFTKQSGKYLDWDLVLIFLGFPFTVNFFLKIFSINSFLDLGGFYIIFLLFFIFLSVHSLSYWLVNLSLKLKYEILGSSKIGLFLVWPLTLLILLSYFSKYLLRYLDKVKFI